ncbi:hypothetical protein CCACVL1_24830 [Corchorus capsularis]|uniref:Uncharacterized protein n=1 Tax=Corchorus capsularis TaxID=210143 RepID=A0A1R3GMV6_COCAP|nr:hypothetical protein CCACVL1_24830 [Corchorus capsularis]
MNRCGEDDKNDKGKEKINLDSDKDEEPRPNYENWFNDFERDDEEDNEEDDVESDCEEEGDEEGFEEASEEYDKEAEVHLDSDDGNEELTTSRVTTKTSIAEKKKLRSLN